MIKHFKNISDYHKMAGLEPPSHPLISLVDYGQVSYTADNKLSWRQDYYTIGLKRNVPYKLYYGQQSYDFDEGVMTFIAPDQVLSLAANPNAGSKEATGWLLLIHPDMLWNHPLATKIKHYAYFEYTVNEALFLSPQEEQMMINSLMDIEREYHANMDRFSQGIVLSHLELLLNYAERYYERQFLTRQKQNHEILSKLEAWLEDYFGTNKHMNEGLPTVHAIAKDLYISQGYLTSMLKSLTGLSTQQHIQSKIIEVAKIQLSSTHDSISEIAYNLGFEHPASFTKLFKKKTSLSPSDFRNQYN